ncbi:MAG: amidohydrolase family protein [Firmicutes bacterium]|nr:amidohydrolase family protein [Candidatus Fiminaster equi]
MNAIINARIYDYVTYIENGYLVYDDKIVEVGDMKNFKNNGYDKVEDFGGDLLMPTFVCAHSHIYSIFARGLILPFNPKNFQDILDQMWWKLDAELVNKETYYSAICAGEEFLLNGVTSVIDHHASGEILGSLKELRKAFVGPLKMRGIFCFETSDRYDVKACLKENSSFAKKYPGEGLFGMHASMSISDKTLKSIAKVQNGVPVHVHVSESEMDEEDSYAKYGKSIIERFDEAGILIPNSLIVHGVHLKDEELDIIAKNKCYMVVNTTSNMNNAVGLPFVKNYIDHNIPVMVGNDGLNSNMASEYMNVLFSGHVRAGSPTALGVGDVQKMIRNSYKYVGDRLGVKLGEFKSGYEADFMRVQYTPFTKMDETNALGHIVFGLFPNFKPSDVYTYGKKRVKNYKITSKSLVNQVIEARKYADNLWAKVKGGK